MYIYIYIYIYYLIIIFKKCIYVYIYYLKNKYAILYISTYTILYIFQ